ncbi:MAG: DUF1570 domain-containing protein [Planctomycetota bacterium]|nr:MAG: DUF1570 domain-containing protein [Planctomycetota bacterium]
MPFAATTILRFPVPDRRLIVRRLAAAILSILVTGEVTCAESKSRLIEIKDEFQTYTGKIIAKDSERCFLMDEFGVLTTHHISRLTSFRIVGDSFHRVSPSEFRKQLLTEFRSGYDIHVSAHYVVVGKKGKAKAYATLFEEIYRQVDSFYSIRGFETSEPEFTMVAIVFNTVDEFKEYCGRDQMLWSEDLRGYYSLKSNRVVLYDRPAKLNASTESPVDGDTSAASTSNDALTADELTLENPASNQATLAAMLNGVAGETADTIVHETTHQVGYNIGIHSRIGETPTWVIEGLATVLEAPGIRVRGSSDAADKINTVRLNWFNTEYESRRQPGDLARMVAGDEVFRNQALDAYSSAWAFTYFMTENPARARSYIRYLRILGERDPLQHYTAEERLKDFQSAFGDVSKIEMDFLRSIDRLENP